MFQRAALRKGSTISRRRKLIMPAAACCVLVVLAASSAAASASGATVGHTPALPSLKGTNGPDVRLSSPARVNLTGIPVQKSNNWSGYIAEPKSGGSKTFDFVTAEYTVPSVNCSKTGSSKAFAYHWVGLDGATDKTVEQDGVADFCVGGKPSYDAWYEMFPAGIKPVFIVDPGDAITSSVTYTPEDGKYTLSLLDVTSNQSFNEIFKCATAGTCHNSSAEVITEAYKSHRWAGTADFAYEFYSGATVTDATGDTGSLTGSDWTTIESEANGSVSHDLMTNPGQIYQGQTASRSAFVVFWNRLN
jgi:hypothetical protein